MSKENLGKLVSFTAGEDLSSDQFTFVSIAADGDVNTTGDGLAADGVTQDNNADAAGKAVGVVLNGITKIACSGTVTRGGPVASDTNGKAVNAATGDVILGTALETGASGTTIAMIFHPRGTA